jgi:hypothetical protein
MCTELSGNGKRGETYDPELPLRVQNIFLYSNKPDFTGINAVGHVVYNNTL